MTIFEEIDRGRVCAAVELYEALRILCGEENDRGTVCQCRELKFERRMMKAERVNVARKRVKVGLGRRLLSIAVNHMLHSLKDNLKT